MAAAIAALGMALWLLYRYSLFIPARRGLPILLYHKVSAKNNNGLTISADRLDRQLAYLKSNGYTSISFADLETSLHARGKLPPKPVLLTFDDAYLNTYELAYPLLQKHQIKATIFLPVAFLGGVNAWDAGNDPLMGYERIRQMDASLIEFGLHSYRHENYERYSAAQVEDDLSKCIGTLEELGCPFTRVFAYPYGRMPRDKRVRLAMRESFRRHGITFAARIGSRVNRLPPRDVYELRRSAMRGTDSFWEFKTKLRKGRCKLF